jgi:hypothetical protein
VGEKGEVDIFPALAEGYVVKARQYLTYGEGRCRPPSPHAVEGRNTAAAVNYTGAIYR